MKEELNLIESIKLGNTKAFSELVDTYKNMVYSVIIRMVKSTEDAEELSQDTFVKAYKAIKQFKGQSKFSTWLYKIAYFTAISHLRKTKMLTRPIDFELIKNSDETAIENLEHFDQKVYIDKALTYLKPIERELVTMFYLDELSNKEIGKITNLSQSNIKVSMLRIRKKMFGIMNTLLKGEAKFLLK